MQEAEGPGERHLEQRGVDHTPRPWKLGCILSQMTRSEIQLIRAAVCSSIGGVRHGDGGPGL